LFSLECIKDKSGTIFFASDGDNLYYHSQESDGDSDLCESISIEQLRVENNGGLKLFTIIELRNELDITFNTKYIITIIRKTISHLDQIISDHEVLISSLKKEFFS
jgi:hypothetical protein